MLRRKHPFWLPFGLFWLTLAAAAALIVVVLASPLVDNEGGPPGDGSRWVALFARDLVLRRTAVASALGLAVTAFVFFRPSAASRPVVRRTLRPPKLPPADIAGA